VSITAYRHDHTIFLSDSDSRPVTVSHPSSYQTTKSFSQELQLVSSADSKINWIVGLFYLNAPSSYDLFRSQTATTMTALTSSQSLHSYSAFGQGSVDIIDNTKLTAGIRYTKDKRAFSLRSLNPTTLATVAGPFNQKASFGAPTWRVSLDHNFTHDILGYVSYNRGFKGGVFNQLSPTNPPVRPTKIDAYEVGLKSDLLDRRLRLNVDGYYYKVRDLQLQAIIQVSPPVTSLINAASGTAYGFEAELEARPVENLTLTGNLSLNHSRITFPNAPFNRPNAGPLPGGNTAVVKDATGNQLGRLAKVAFNLGGQYLVPVGENSLTFAANWSHTGAFFWETVNRLRQPKYDLVNGSITFATKGDRWSLRVWSKNLFNQKYFSYAISSAATGDTAVAGDPRTFGATVGVKF
jgi:iron complex outermembrane receptor protein